MADPSYTDAAFAIGTTPKMIESVIQPQDDTSDFGSWFKSEKGQVMIGGLFNAIGSLGAGLAGMPLGGTDMSSVGRGAAMASQGWNVAQQQYDNRQFTNFIDKQIATEEGQTNPDQEKLMTLQMMRRNPEAWIKGQATSDNWMEKYDYVEGQRIASEQRKYDAGLLVANNHFNSAVDPKERTKMMEGDGATFRGFALLNPEVAAYLLGPGGELANVSFEGIPKDRSGFKLSDLWTWTGYGGGEDEGESTTTAAAVTTEEEPSELNKWLTGKDVPERTAGEFYGGIVKHLSEAGLPSAPKLKRPRY